jgi:hypothetical protein
MANQVNLPKDKELAKQVLDNHNELTRIKTDQGVLGQIWGSSASIPNNIAALAILILLATGIIYTFCVIDKSETQIGLSIKDFWAIIAPLITLSIGYLFGDKQKKNGT